MTEKLLQAIALADDDWDEAHRIVQALDDPLAAWIHAVLHKIEGDADNSRYWYARAGKPECFALSPADEWPRIRKAVEARPRDA